MRHLIGRALLGLALAVATMAAAPEFTPNPELLAAARKEGKLVLYTANFIETKQEIVSHFNKRFPDIKVEIIRAPTGQLVTRIKTEAANGKLFADVIELADREQAISLVELFAPYAPPNAADYREDMRSADRLWPSTANAWAIAYNHELVKDPPKTWADLTKPEYAKLGIGLTVAISGGGPWGLALFQRQVLGEDYWAKLAATKPRLFPSQAPMVDAMMRGEVALAPLVTDLAIPVQKRGGPIHWLFAPEGAPVTIFAEGLGRTGKSPNAGRLYLDWELSLEGQEASMSYGGLSGLKGAPLPDGVDPATVKLWIANRDDYRNLREPWVAEWSKVFGYRQ